MIDPKELEQILKLVTQYNIRELKTDSLHIVSSQAIPAQSPTTQNPKPKQYLDPKDELLNLYNDE
jgi:hypothetical protein